MRCSIIGSTQVSLIGSRTKCHESASHPPTRTCVTAWILLSLILFLVAPFPPFSHALYVVLYFFRFTISCLHHGLCSFVPHLSLLYLFCSPLSFLSTCLFTGWAVKLDLPHFSFPRASSFDARVIITLELRPFVLHVASYLFCIPSFCGTLAAVLSFRVSSNYSDLLVVRLEL